eukprot:6172707-Pleurochrysis_carterae.AAC.2
MHMKVKKEPMNWRRCQGRGGEGTAEEAGRRGEKIEWWRGRTRETDASCSPAMTEARKTAVKTAVRTGVRTMSVRMQYGSNADGSAQRIQRLEGPADPEEARIIAKERTTALLFVARLADEPQQLEVLERERTQGSLNPEAGARSGDETERAASLRVPFHADEQRNKHCVWGAHRCLSELSGGASRSTRAIVLCTPAWEKLNGSRGKTASRCARERARLNARAIFMFGSKAPVQRRGRKSRARSRPQSVETCMESEHTQNEMKVHLDS